MARGQFDASATASDGQHRASYGELVVVGDALRKLRGDAEACVGVPDLYKQESDVMVTHPDFPDDPTVDDPFQPEVEAPAYASPFA
jgi:hypothetical protein